MERPKPIPQELTEVQKLQIQKDALRESGKRTKTIFLLPSDKRK